MDFFVKFGESICNSKDDFTFPFPHDVDVFRVMCETVSIPTESCAKINCYHNAKGPFIYYVSTWEGGLLDNY